MKRISLAIIAILTLTAGFAQLREDLPVTVLRFLDERADQQRLIRANHADAIPMMAPSKFAPPRIIDGIEMVDAFISFDNRDVLKSLQAQGVIINCELDDFATAQIPVNKLSEIARMPSVTDVEISKLLELCTDSTLVVTHAGQVLNGTDYGLPQGYDGTGVIIGIIDTGFDYQHLAFRDANDPSRSRIVRVYDPENNTGHPARSTSSQMPGSIFMGEQIDTLTTDLIGESHGTVTASIAAGKHVNGYGGMAPGAEIVLCCSRGLNINISETQVVNCMRYIYSYADSVGKPCVVSVSVSTNLGPHDGSGYISRAAELFTKSGHIFVIAAGNSARPTFYASGSSTANRPFNTAFGLRSDINADNTYYYKFAQFEAWVRDKNVKPVIQFHILDKRTNHVVWQSELINSNRKIDLAEINQYYGPDTSVDSTGYLSATITRNSTNSKYQVQCTLYNLLCQDNSINDYGIHNSRYAIGVTIYPPSVLQPAQPDSCYIDSWVGVGERPRFNGPIYIDEINENGDTTVQAIDGFYARTSSDCSIGTHAVHDSIISAGGYISHDTYFMPSAGFVHDNNCTLGAIYDLSSYQRQGFGPTGAALPTVTAPAVYVISAASRYWNGFAVMRVDGHKWGYMTGTSMAAPTVAGIIAQWLQIKPDLTPSEIKTIITQTAIKDDFTQSIDNGYRFGPNGKIDALAGARYLLHISDDLHIGDVNEDGFINVTDVSTLINYLLLLPDDESMPVNDIVNINQMNADLNEDGTISITDLSMLINYLMTVEEQ